MQFYHRVLHKFRLLFLSAALSFSAAASVPAATSTYWEEGAVMDKPGPGWALTAISTQTNNLDQPASFGGGEVRFLANESSETQQLCGVFRSPEGRVLVVDGGLSEDADHLCRVLQEFGGRVDAWLITHPQPDHIGALCRILQEPSRGIDIQNIYFSFLSEEEYEKLAPDELDSIRSYMNVLKSVPKERLHGFGDTHVKTGETVYVSDSLSFRALNDPLFLTGPWAVNNSSIMYDINLSGSHVIILGDMGPDGGDRLLTQIQYMNLTADYVVMAHHGQNGVRENFYRMLQPKACIWSAPDWLFNAMPDHKSLRTADTRSWINKLGVTRNYCTKDGDVVLK